MMLLWLLVFIALAILWTPLAWMLFSVWRKLDDVRAVAQSTTETVGTDISKQMAEIRDMLDAWPHDDQEKVSEHRQTIDNRLTRVHALIEAMEPRQRPPLVTREQPALGDTQTLLLMHGADVEHEVSVHEIGDPAETWAYAGKVYRRTQDAAIDGVWVYQR